MPVDEGQQPNDIHLLTMDALLATLIGGGSVACDGNEVVGPLSEGSRSVLAWYHANGGRWSGNLTGPDADAIVDAVDVRVPDSKQTTSGSEAKAKRRIRLVRVVAHHFGGLHSHGACSGGYGHFEHAPGKSVMVFEGPNGSGKTSILNAVVWCLTGCLIRSQREPELGPVEVSCEIAGADGTVGGHLMSSVTPMPHAGDQLPPEGKPIPADTWVELTFTDQDGTPLPPLRREQVRKLNGKLVETPPDLEAFGLDPVSWRIAAIMPALLPFLPVGSPSQLGQAVAKLTGLSELVDLARHAAKAEERISRRMTRELTEQRAVTSSVFNQATVDLMDAMAGYPAMAVHGALPSLQDPDIGVRLGELADHFAGLKTRALEGARVILGESFDSGRKDHRDGLEADIRPAKQQLGDAARLPSVARLLALKPDDGDIGATVALLDRIEAEARTLAELAANPDRSRRVQLYARISAWMRQHGHEVDGTCPVCVAPLQGVVDPVTGVGVAEHLGDASADREFVARTTLEWAQHWVGHLLRELPPRFAVEARHDLPEAPIALLRLGLVDELFATDGFTGTLSNLRQETGALFDEVADTLPAFTEPTAWIPDTALAAQVTGLVEVMGRVRRALAFAEWLFEHGQQLRRLIQTIRGRGDQATGGRHSLGQRLESLLAIVEGTLPLTSATRFVDRMRSAVEEDVARRRRLEVCSRAAAALRDIVPLGNLAEAQVGALRVKLQRRSDWWRRKVYRNATDFAPDPTGTSMTAKGVLEFKVGRKGISAPAQHVSNASALRGSLLGFLLAFREHVLDTRGGVETLLLDDPQDLLDGDNRDRLARGMATLASSGAQLLVTTHNARFARTLVAENRPADRVEHLSVHPVHASRPTLALSPSIEQVDHKRLAFERSDEVEAARDYAAAMRVFLEARLGDLFDDAAYPAFSAPTKAPSLEPLLGRLRGLVSSKASELFMHPAVKRFADDYALKDGAEARRVLNEAHHGVATLTYVDVREVSADLARLRTGIEQVHEQFRLYRWREPLATLEATGNAAPVPLRIASCKFDVPLYGDVAAFSSSARPSHVPDVPTERLDDSWFKDKCLFYVKQDTLGARFRSGWVAIAEAEPSQGEDHDLVIAFQGSEILARRITIGIGSAGVSLVAQSAGSGDRRPTRYLQRGGLRLHRIVGAIFSEMPPPTGKGEAIPVEGAPELDNISTAFRVVQDSAVPVISPGQVLLGAQELTPATIGRWEGRFAAVALASGASVVKRIGPRLPGKLGHLRMFESIGAGGLSEVVAMEEVAGHEDMPLMVSARLVVGVLYGSPSKQK